MEQTVNPLENHMKAVKMRERRGNKIFGNRDKLLNVLEAAIVFEIGGRKRTMFPGTIGITAGQ